MKTSSGNQFFYSVIITGIPGMTAIPVEQVAPALERTVSTTVAEMDPLVVTTPATAWIARLAMLLTALLTKTLTV